jgi:two-component system response regulator
METHRISRVPKHPATGEDHQQKVECGSEPFILVAEDDSNDEHLLKWAFTRAGLHTPVYFVHNGAEAMDYLLGTPPYVDRRQYPLPNLLMLDLKMPCVDGFELLSWVRRLPGLDQLSVAVMSGSSCQQDFERARQLGADFCLNKALDFSELVDAIQDVVGRRKGQKC